MAKKKKLPTNETHGALEPKEPMNMMKAFGIRDGYNTDSIDLYRQEILEMNETDLHNHSHKMGVIPVAPKSKLIAMLETKFHEAKAKQRPMKTSRVPTRADTDPEFKKMMNDWWSRGKFA